MKVTIINSKYELISLKYNSSKILNIAFWDVSNYVARFKLGNRVEIYYIFNKIDDFLPHNQYYAKNQFSNL